MNPNRRPHRQTDLAVVRTDPTRQGKIVGFRWMQFVWYCQLAGQKALVVEVECCHCHQTVGVTEAYTTVPVDSRGVPSGGYLHCGACMLHGDPKLAWQVAHADDVRRTGENSAPVADGLTSVTP